MTNSEFDEWITFHFSCFTGCTGWLAKFPTTARHVGDPTQRSIIDRWRETMRPVDLKHAKTASQRLSNGEESFPGQGFDCHPSTVRRLALKVSGIENVERKRKPTIINGEEVFDCKIGCKDSGFLTLWHPTALKFFKNTLAEEPPLNWREWTSDKRSQAEMRRGQLYEACVVLCTCDVGMTKKSSAQRYDENKHIIFDGDPQDAIKKFALTPSGGWGLDGDF